MTHLLQKPQWILTITTTTVNFYALDEFLSFLSVTLSEYIKRDDNTDCLNSTPTMDLSPTQTFIPNDFLPTQIETANVNKTRSRRPCDSCRRRKSRCEIIDAGPPCVCELPGTICVAFHRLIRHVSN